ncbi:thioredoxin-dependent thiol peroxidase [Halohasta litchfieldiae]|jgi:peroxiredoxin Q/BCP|uniref:thioredoxin-dependent peroxiredoxin n=1 Tax=Halohasta litchfieldiae TaxID=1073996 RepID=A0A1H6RER9_9EURY|nr:thioredoxin-dependent thiol peroxidase [Halohasta litchfieldiae]SEI54253.1 peroxiredoxin Q/BCP [Halohasta litchfieldiae]
MLSSGEPAPTFDLENQHGETVSLSSVDGEYAVVYFYPRADTPGCTTEAKSFRDQFAKFEERGITVFGISDDPVEDLAAFAEKHDLPFELLSDPDGEVGRSYDSYGEKNMFGRTFDGVFRNTYIVAPDGTIARAFEGVSPADHADEVLDALTELQNA